MCGLLVAASALAIGGRVAAPMDAVAPAPTPLLPALISGMGLWEYRAPAEVPVAMPAAPIADDASEAAPSLEGTRRPRGPRPSHDALARPVR